jgi:hypothetical protein
MNAQSQSSYPSTSPFPGLRPFTTDEAEIFFGRDEQIDRLLEKLKSRRFLVVVGSSGCGKSSLVRAGLMADLEGGLMSEAGARWQMTEMRPGNHPFTALAYALLANPSFRSGFLPTLRSSDDMQSRVGLLRAALRVGPLGLVEVLKQSRLPRRTNFFLLVDQFEEVFAAREAGFADETEAFVALLLATAEQRKLPLYVVVTMRTDYLGDCPIFPGLAEAINRSLFLAPRLNRDQRREAIVGPVKLYGGDIDAKLVNHLLNKAGSSQDQLPLLQHLLMRMWTLASDRIESTGQQPVKVELRFHHYEVAGGLEQALSKHAGAAYEDLDERQQRIAQVLFRAICEFGPNGRERRRLAGVQTIADLAGATVDEVTKVAHVFRRPGRNFLMPPTEFPLAPETNLDISHEALIRNWDRLSAWVQAEADSAKSYLLLEQTAQRHKKGQAALWNTPDLETILEWEKKAQPSVLWAKRYGGDFSLAMDFLRQSEKQQELNILQKKQEQEAREESLRRLAREEKTRADANKRAAEAERSLREIEERSRQTARERSQNYLLRAKQRIDKENRPKRDVIALYYLSLSLRLDQANSEAAELVYKLLLQRNWLLPVTTAIHSSSQILSSAFSPDGCKAVAVVENGELLSLSGTNFSTRSMESLFPEIETPLGGKLLVSASFSSNGEFLLVGFTPDKSGTVKARMFRRSESDQSYQPVYNAVDISGPFRFPLVCNEDASLFITLSQKFDWASYQVFRLTGETYSEVSRPFGEAEVTAALYATDIKQVVTASPGGVIRFWDPSDLQHPNQVEDAKACIRLPKGGSPYLLALGPEKNELSALVYAEPVQIVNIHDSSFRFIHPSMTDDIIAWFAFSPDMKERRLLAITSNGRVDVSSTVEPTQPVAEPLCFQGLMGYPMFSPDAKYVLILSGPFWHTMNTIQLWNTQIRPAGLDSDEVAFDRRPAPKWLPDLAEVISGVKVIMDEDDPESRTLAQIADAVAPDQVQGAYRNIWRRFLANCSSPLS